MGAILRRTRCGGAKRRRERRHRAYLKYARMSVVVALAEYKHHTSRCQRMDRVGGWERAALHGHVPEHPTPQAAGTEYFSLDVEDVSAAALRLGVLAEPRPQERVQRHTVEHIVDLVRVPPMVQILGAPVPQMASSASFRRSHLIPSRLSKCPRSCLRTFLCAP